MLLKRIAAAIDENETLLQTESESTVEETVNYIEWLMVWYCRRPSVILANIIVDRLESLRQRVQQGEVLAPEWSCQRLLQNWEYIAARGRARIRA